MKTTVLCIVALALIATPALADLSVAGGLFWSGKVAPLALTSSLEIARTPVVLTGDAMLGEGFAAVGISTPVRTVADPIAKLLGITWATPVEPWLDRIAFGGLVAYTTKDVRLEPGLYGKVELFQFRF